ncbi:MAG: AraC family transcriptional regulator [Burkholderiales bacterium]|nr:AraC family transcriptional regulator [Burkholderiales bacterium]
MPAAPLDFFAARPRPPLDAFVELIWATRGAAPYRRAAVLPNGALQLMLNFGPPHRLLSRAGRTDRREFREAWVAGLQELPLEIEAPGETDIFAIRFRPGGAHAFFGGSLQALTHEVVDSADWLRRDVAELRERVAAAPTRGGQCRAAESWLLARLAPREPAHALVQRAIAVLAEPFPGHPGQPARSVRETCEWLGLSNRHLIALFRRHVGLAPKTYARVRRFHGAMAALAAGAPQADLAAQLGFADQAHMGNDFRRLAGVTPGEFVARRGLDNESVILG